MRGRGWEASLTPTELVARARDGDRVAWAALVHRYERLVWRVVSLATNDRALREEAAQETWVALVMSLGSLREPEALPGWLSTTARNKVHALGRQRRERPEAWVDRAEPAATTPGPVEQIDEDELRRALRAAFHKLPERCKTYLGWLVLADPPLSYEEVSKALNEPHGSLGPKRGRCIDLLRRMPDLSSYVYPAGAS